jgi:cytochrome P450
MTMLEQFEKAEARSRAEANHLLLDWLSDDEQRALLYAELRRGKGRVLKFQSRADTKERSWHDDASTFHQEAYLLSTRADVEAAMTNKVAFSNAPYRALGSGTFMLGLNGTDHHRQRKFGLQCLAVDDATVRALASVAFQAAAVLPLKQRAFDLVELAEQAAARFVGFLFGFEQADHALIEQTMRDAYRGLNFQILGRHFVSEPGAVDEASRQMGRLLKRTAQLIDLYRGAIGREQEELRAKLDHEREELREFENWYYRRPLAGFQPLLRRIAEQPAEGYSGAQLAVIVVGMIAGTIGNIQASVCIAIDEFLADQALWEMADKAAADSTLADPDYDKPAPALENLIWEALRRNPPAAFLPRTMNQDMMLGGEKIAKGSTLILAVGGATRHEHEAFRKDAEGIDALVFGGPKGDDAHQCIGQLLAMPVVAHFVRRVLRLDGLARTFDAKTGKVQRLEKLWGFNCQKFPLEYTRSARLAQSPLIVIMRVKSPVAEHAERLKAVIKHGAPRIEKKLRDSKHVHFASFIFLENDTKLALYTVYDRDFDSYLEHFALEIGPLTPVDKFPKEFVDTIRRYNARPAVDYFFSAYPRTRVDDITNHFKEKP